MSIKDAVKGKSVPDMVAFLESSIDAKNLELAVWSICEYDSSECLEELITRKLVNITITNDLGNCPVIEAARQDSRKVLQVFQSKSLILGVDTKRTNFDGWTALLYCAYNGNEDGVASLIKKGSDVNVCDSAGYTPLLRCIFSLL